MLEETEKQGRSTEKGEKKKTAAAVSNDLRPLQNRSCWEREGGGGSVHLCVQVSASPCVCASVGVSTYVCLRAECGGANGVLIAWR